MKKTLSTWLLAGVLIPGSVLAGGFKIALQGQKQIGMGHTGVGFSQDAATVYFNPAGMGFARSGISAGVNLLMPSTSFLDANTNQITNSTSQVFTPLSLFGNVALNKKVNFGLGVYTPYGSGIMYPANWTGRYILNRIDLKVVYIQPTLSVKLSEKFSIGAGFIYSQGHVGLERDLPLSSNQGNTTASVKLDGRASGIGFNAGAYFKASERFSIGMAYHSKVNMEVEKGDATFNDVPMALSSSFPEANYFSSELPLPSELAAGFSYKLTSRLTAAVDFNLTFWKSFDTLSFDYQTNSAALADSKSPRLYENASAIRLGFQYLASEGLQLRAGAFYDQTPVKDGYVAPELPDNNKVGLTLGASARLHDKLVLDLSLLYEDVPERNQTNKETGLAGTFQTRVFSPGVGLTYLFGKLNKRKNY